MTSYAILQLHEGYPNIGVTTPTYIAAIQADGFMAAHTCLLQDLKAWFEADPAYRLQCAEMLAHIFRLTNGLLLAALEVGADLPNNCYHLCNALFAQVLGAEGQTFLEARQQDHDAAQQRFEAAIQDYMATLGISRYEAETLYLEAVDEHIRLIRTMGPLRQVEDTLGRIEWDEP